MAKKRSMFVARTPLGYRVSLSRNRWREIIRYKHPALEGHETAVRECLRDPELVRSSVKDSDVHLYYRSAVQGHVCVVIGGDDPQERFVVTAYFTRSIKEGADLWTK